MGFIDDAKENAKDAWEDTTDRIDEKADEKKADADVHRAETHHDSVEQRNEVKENLRDA